MKQERRSVFRRNADEIAIDFVHLHVYSFIRFTFISLLSLLVDLWPLFSKSIAEFSHYEWDLLSSSSRLAIAFMWSMPTHLTLLHLFLFSIIYKRRWHWSITPPSLSLLFSLYYSFIFFVCLFFFWNMGAHSTDSPLNPSPFWTAACYYSSAPLVCCFTVTNYTMTSTSLDTQYTHICLYWLNWY